MRFRHKYVGKHVVGVLTSKPVPQGVPSYRATFQLSLKCLAKGKLTFDKQIHGISAPWWSRSESGFTLIDYNVPKDLPLEEEVECVVAVDVADPEFEGQYGPLRLFVRKDTEK